VEVVAGVLERADALRGGRRAGLAVALSGVEAEVKYIFQITKAA